MTYVARKVLEDCRKAHSLLENESDLQIWRIHWFGALALLRAVGHVLDKVDAAENPALKIAQNEAYKVWKSCDPSHEIFREFIEKQRNIAVKEYSFQYDMRNEIPIAIHGNSVIEQHLLQDNLFRPLTDGFGAGSDARDVYAEAIDWWEMEIRKLEELILLP